MKHSSFSWFPRFLAGLLVCITPFTYSNAQCVITLQPDGITGKDAELFGLDCSAPYAVSNGPCQTTNYGTSKQLRSKVWTWWGEHSSLRSLLEFDLSSIPSGCTVSNATLVMRNANNNPNQYHCGQNSTIVPCMPNPINIHRVTSSWDEMTVNWLTQPSFTNTTISTDFATAPNNSLPYNDYNFDITDMVNYWLANPAQNFGLMFKQADETTHYQSVWFASSDHPDPTVRPELILTLNCNGNCNNTIEGTIYDDTDLNCAYSGADLPLENWLVEILPGPIYATTDASGYYSANVLNGTYTVNQIIPNSNIWQAGCPSNSSQTVTVSGGTTATADFALEAQLYCPILTVDVASSFLRKCHTENFIVHYCNEGNQTAQGVYIDVNFSPGLTPLSSNIAYTANSPQQWTFQIGTLAPGACASFHVTTLVSCDAEFGDIECVTAEIFPDYACSEPDPTDPIVWDSSSVVVSGYCDGDSLACFTITNTGSDMQTMSNYRIYDNNVLISLGTYQLVAGANTTVCWPTSGNTIRLEADNNAGHPNTGTPSTFVDNCGINSSLFNFGLTLPECDVPADIAIECAEVRSSYDPNDKRVIPSGVGPYNCIDQNILLDYKIRFQNTGNDTALNIVILDTLSSNLDITTIQMGASSHGYTYSIEGSGVIRFNFSNIMLPDSNVNEPLSHGFVKFKINQKQDLPYGTVIDNSAAIYFDYNAPIITNNASLTICDMSQVLTFVDEVQEPTATINIFPNPFNQQATVNIAGYNGNETIDFELYNALGKRVQLVQSNEKQFEINRNDLPAGVYLYRATANKQLLGIGKLIIE